MLLLFIVTTIDYNIITHRNYLLLFIILFLFTGSELVHMLLIVALVYIALPAQIPIWPGVTIL